MEQELSNKHERDLGLYAAVFICGFVVMVFEIIGSRIVAPFIGTSTYVWTSLIGIILAALSLGYWIGGRIADRTPSRDLLAGILISAAGLIALATLTKELVLSAAASVDLSIELRSVAAALLLFAPASVALGMVTPFAVKLRLSSPGETGTTVGRIYALSTIGSIAGTFAAGFVLIPFVGSIRCLYLITALLILGSLFLAPFRGTQTNILILVLIVTSVFVSEGMTLVASRAGIVDIDTRYDRVQIFEASDPATGRPIRALSMDPYSTQSAMFLDSDDLVFEYSKFYHLAPLLVPEMKRTLLIGGAGYSFPKSFLARYPDSSIDIVEIDPAMTEIAKRYFRFREDPRAATFHEDGRTFLRRAPGGVYDVVFMDAFTTLFSVPFQLTTVEAVRDVKKVLTDRGAVILNLGSSLTGPASLFLQAETQTYRTVFPSVYVFKVKSQIADDRLQNVIIIACKAECLPVTSPTAETGSLLSRLYIGPIGTTVPILTDDLAPVERYNSIAHSAGK